MWRLITIGTLLVAVALAKATDVRAATTAAREAQIAFDIAAQPLGSALNQFAMQSGQDILFLPRLTDGLRSPQLRATLSTNRALEILLAGSGLRHRQVGFGLSSQGILIEAEPNVLVEGPVDARLPEDKMLASIVVTATRVGTLMQDTPMSVSVLTGAELDASGAGSLSAVGTLLPSLNESRTTSAETHRFTVRGVRGSGETTTGLYYNDIPVSGPTGTSADAGMALPELRLVDIKRIELLRGPQGTLYGAGAMGGSLRVLFNDPAFEQFDVWVRGQASLTDARLGTELAATINVPLSLHAAARFVAYGDMLPGYIDNSALHLHDVNAESVSGARLAIAANVSDHASAQFTAAYQRGSTDDAVTWSVKNGPFDSASPVRLPFDNQFALFNLRLVWQRDASRLQLNSAYYSWDLVRRLDYTDTMVAFRTNADACARYQQITQPCSVGQLSAYTTYVDMRTPALLQQPMNVSAWIHEVLWQGRRGILSWTAGIYLEDRSDSVDGQVLPADASSGLPNEQLGFIGRRTLEHQLEQRALFGEVEFALTPHTRLTTGARIYDYAKTGAAEVTVSNYVSGLVAPSSLTAESNADGTSLKALLAQDLSEDVLLYAQAAQGFRPGGVNFNPGLASQFVEYRADSVWSYELGLKTTWFDQRLAGNVAIYRIDWRDMQSTVATRSGASRYLSNIGQARNNGVEADFAFQATPRLRFAAYANYTDARLTEDQSNGVLVGLGKSGDHIPVIPQWAASTAVDYKQALGAELRLNVHADTSYIANAYTGFNPSNVEYAKRDAVTLINVRASLEPTLEDETWRVSIFIDNILNRTPNTQVLNNLNGPPQASGPRPRTIGVGFERSFR